jgi:hypothetical protein
VLKGEQWPYSKVNDKRVPALVASATLKDEFVFSFPCAHHKSQVEVLACMFVCLYGTNVQDI